MIEYKQGDVVSMILVIVSIFIIGILIFFFSHLSDALYTSLGDYFEDTEFNDTEVTDALDTIHATELVVWDYAFLGLAMGYFLSLLLTAFATKISPVFYFIYAMISLIGLGLATILSNIWQGVSTSPEFATTIARFPITDALLGTYYPTLIGGIIILFMVLLFGKSQDGGL